MATQALHDWIVDFLTSIPSQNQFARCRCGAEMEPQNVTLFYDGQSWDVVIHACRKCHPVLPSAFAHEA